MDDAGNTAIAEAVTPVDVNSMPQGPSVGGSSNEINQEMHGLETQIAAEEHSIQNEAGSITGAQQSGEEEVVGDGMSGVIVKNPEVIPEPAETVQSVQESVPVPVEVQEAHESEQGAARSEEGATEAQGLQSSKEEVVSGEEAQESQSSEQGQGTLESQEPQGSKEGEVGSIEGAQGAQGREQGAARSAEGALEEQSSKEEVVSIKLEQESVGSAEVQAPVVARDAMAIARTLDRDVLEAAFKLLSMERLPKMAEAKRAKDARDRQETDSRITGLISKYPNGVRRTTIADKLNLSPSKVTDHLQILTRNGRVRAEGKTNDRRFFV